MTYLYPDHLRTGAILWLRDLRDIEFIGIGTVFSIACFPISGIPVSVVLTTVYDSLSIQFDDTRTRDSILCTCAFFVTQQQTYEWRKR